jgi:hypothetical protein
MTHNEAEAELSYLKTLAENGQTAPAIGGRFALWWGTLTALIMITHWAILVDIIAAEESAFMFLWIGYIIVGSIGSFVLGRSISNKPGAGSPGNRHASAVWGAIGFCVLAFFFTILAGVSINALEPVFFNLMLPVAMMAYGLGWLSSAFMTRSFGMAIPGLIALGGMSIAMINLSDPVIYLITALTLILSTSIPGAIQMIREPKSVV